MLAMLFVVAVAVSAAIANDLSIERHTIGGGITRGTGGAFELSGTLGQADTGVMTGGSLTISGGFWFGQVPCDCNYDAGVNLLDYDGFRACLSGPGGGIIDPVCACFDLDTDDDVDMLDFGALEAAFTPLSQV